MNVVVEVDHREAIPVRAIPLLTDWNFFSPDVIAAVFAGSGGASASVFGDLHAFSFNDGHVQPVSKRWWKNWAIRELQALSEKIKLTQLTHEEGYVRWRSESLAVLPPGVFVWKVEFEKLHSKNWSARSRMLTSSIADDDQDRAERSSPSGDRVSAFVERALAHLDKWRELDYSPFMRPEMRAVLMEGFESKRTLVSPVADMNAGGALDAEARRRLVTQARLARATTPQGIAVSGGRTIAPLDYPLRACDFKTWTRLDSLPIEQACFAMLGFEPPPLHVLRFEQDMWNSARVPTWEVPPDYEIALRALRVSIQHGNVSARRITEFPYETQHITWSELVRWAMAKGFTVSAEVEAIGAKMDQATGDTRHLPADNKLALSSATPPPERQAATIAAGASDGEPVANWRHRIQAEAWEHWLRLRASGCNPSPHSICDDMAEWCIKHNVKGGKGQNPRAGTIRNTVLGAGHWTPPHHSVAEARKHVAQIEQTAQTKVAQSM